MPFSFSYRGMYRVAPDPGGYVKVQRRRARPAERLLRRGPPAAARPRGARHGRASAVRRIYVRDAQPALRRLQLRGEGKTKVNNVPAYHVFYTAPSKDASSTVATSSWLPERPGAREGVDIVMLTSTTKASVLGSADGSREHRHPRAAAEILHPELGAADAPGRSAGGLSRRCFGALPCPAGARRAAACWSRMMRLTAESRIPDSAPVRPWASEKRTGSAAGRGGRRRGGLRSARRGGRQLSGLGRPP